MRSDDILDAIGEVDEALVRKAREIKKSHKAVWLTLSSIAACFLLAFMLSIVFISMKGASSADPSAPSQEDNENDGVRTHVSIYYIDGDTLASDEILWGSARDVFNAWRDANGLGEEVEYKSHFYLATTDDPPSSVNVFFVITNELEDYYETIDKDLLIKSLKLTLSEYLNKPEDDILLSLQ